MVENARKVFILGTQSVRLTRNVRGIGARLEFDTERPRNWGSFGAELNGLKPWRRGGFRCFLGGWLVVENARKVFILGTQSVRLTRNVRGIGARLEFDTERPRNWARLEQNSMG